MRQRIPILICGDAGPVRHALLARSDLDVLWTDTIQEALATVRAVQPQICLVRPHLLDGSAIDLLRQCRDRGSPPCVVVLDESEWDTQGEFLAAGAVEVIEINRSESVLQLVGEYTGLQFAKDARTPFGTVVEAKVNGEEMVLETTDISASGVGVRRFPETRLGTLVRLAFVVQANPIVIWARVVRCWTRDNEPCAGLRFAGLTKTLRRQLRDFVEAQNASLPQAPIDFGNLFDDVVLPVERPRALRSDELIDTTESIAPDDPDLAMLSKYAKADELEDRDALDLPVWLLRLAEALTPLEIAAARDEAEAPHWGRSVLGVRIMLARDRAASPNGPLTECVGEKAYELFLALPKVTADADDAMVVQIGQIRAAILRELVATPTRGRGDASRTSDEASSGLIAING